MRIFLDDIRESWDDSWVIVRSPQAFRDIVICSTSFTDISLDHDLGTIMDNPIPGAPQYEETGYDLTKWLVDHLKDNTKKQKFLQTIIIHSQNPIGRENMKNYLDTAKENKYIWPHIQIIVKPKAMNGALGYM